MNEGPERKPASPTDASADTSAGASPSACEVDLPQFEGPLDLLLHLVRRHELDILDIPIAFVCEKYLEYLDFMRALDLEVAGDYLVMAATLAWLKSRELVPTEAAPGEDVGQGPEDGADPRAELIARLLEYQAYRAAADELDRLAVTGRDVFERGGTVEVDAADAGLASVTLYRLAEAYHRVLERARILKSHEVVLERVSVSTRMQQLTLILVDRTRFDFEQLFLERSWTTEHELRAMLIVTLMSILELVRLGVARVHQAEESETLIVERAATAQEAQQALADYDEQISFGRPPAPGPLDDTDEPDDEEASPQWDADSNEGQGTDASARAPAGPFVLGAGAQELLEDHATPNEAIAAADADSTGLAEHTEMAQDEDRELDPANIGNDDG